MDLFYTRSCLLSTSLEMRPMQGAKIAPPARVRPTRTMHSLETADPEQDILTLQKIMFETEQYMAE